VFARIAYFSKQVGFILAAIAGFGALYVTFGLPIPISEAAVNGKISPIMGVLASVQRSQIEIRGDLTALQRQQLRNERLALESAVPNASPQNKVAFNLRLGQIQDEMAKLDRRDELTAKELEGK